MFCGLAAISPTVVAAGKSKSGNSTDSKMCKCLDKICQGKSAKFAQVLCKGTSLYERKCNGTSGSYSCVCEYPFDGGDCTTQPNPDWCNWVVSFFWADERYDHKCIDLCGYDPSSPPPNAWPGLPSNFDASCAQCSGSDSKNYANCIVLCDILNFEVDKYPLKTYTAGKEHCDGNGTDSTNVCLWKSSVLNKMLYKLAEQLKTCSADCK